MSALLGMACADLERGPRPEMPEAGAAEGAADDGRMGTSFSAVRPLLMRGCASCHAAGREAGNTILLLGTDPAADYASVRTVVDPTNPAASRLLGKAAGQGHAGGTVWMIGSSEYAAVLAWISGGARP